ncbi:hypothetical protein P3S67_016936 [Capsicum chacoense]
MLASSSPIPDPPQADESVSRIMKEENVISDAYSTNNCTEAVSDANNGEEEEEEGPKEVDGQNENQESKQGERGKHGNQENNNGEEEEAGESQLGEADEEDQNVTKKKKTTERIQEGTPEGDEGEEDTENDDNQEENDDQVEDEEEYELVIEEDDNEEEEEEEKEEEELLKKRKQQVSEQLSVTEYYVDYDADPLDVSILRSILDFKCHYGYYPHPPSLDLIYQIMTSVPDLEIRREELMEKIIAYKENFNKVRKLEGDNPQMDQPIDPEFFDLFMRIWGNQDDDGGLR